MSGNHPQRVNQNHFTTEKFPEIIAFCERDESSHVQSPTEESFEYTLNGKGIYMLKKYAAQWELVEHEDHKVVRVSTGVSLGMVLLQGLRFSNTDKGKQEERVNIIIPVAKADVEKALALMYYYGGYPGNFLIMTPELAIITERFIDPEITFLSYSYFPAVYLEWLREMLKENDILQEGSPQTLWVYKK